MPSTLVYHITYMTRSHECHTGRVTLNYNPWQSAAKQRQTAIQAAYYRYPNAIRSTIRAVRVRTTV